MDPESSWEIKSFRLGERAKVCVCDLAVVVAKFRVLLSLGIDVVVLFLRDGVGKELFFRT